jgi:hypothetical protein
MIVPVPCDASVIITGGNANSGQAAALEAFAEAIARHDGGIAGVELL